MRKDVQVIAATPSPADNWLETLFLLDALKHAGAGKIHLILTYFGYARQDHPDVGECHAGEKICEWLSEYPLKQIDIVHMHSHNLNRFLPYQSLVPYDIIQPLLSHIDAIVAPDAGAAPVIDEIATEFNMATVKLIKSRPEQEKVVIKEIQGDVSGKKVLIVDDMITTGKTLIEAAQALKKAGASEVQCYATHGVFSKDAVDKIQNSPITHLYVTNSLHQKSKLSRKIKVLDLSPWLQTLLTLPHLANTYRSVLEEEMV